LLDKSRSERAMIIIDMVYALAHPNGLFYRSENSDIIPYIQGELTYFRERQRPIIFVNSACYQRNQHEPNLSEMHDQIIGQLKPRTKEICISKTEKSAFFKTPLVELLQELKVGTLTLVGFFSHTSIIATAASALDLGLFVVVPETCVGAEDAQDHSAALRLINSWIRGQAAQSVSKNV
jgi:nicotinamidase-related amidase